MGVSGSGKSTVGNAIAQRLDIGFIDGDDLHTPESIEKMSTGIALTDQDRKEWIQRINLRLIEACETSKPVAIAASLLKAEYRIAAIKDVEPRPLKVLLTIPLDESINRLMARKGHFMPPELAASQFEILDDTAEVDLVVDGTIELNEITGRIAESLSANG